MAADEVEALTLAIRTVASNEWPRRNSYFIELRGDEWHVHFERDHVIRVSRASGALLEARKSLDADEALRIAREYAASQSLAWRPSFSLRLESDEWQVGACQSQLGGQVEITVSVDGNVTGHRVNPK